MPSKEKLPDTVLCNLQTEFVIKFALSSKPGRGASWATKAALLFFLLMQFIYLIFSWTFNYGNLVISPCTSKQLYMKVNSKSGAAQTGSLWFCWLSTYLSMLCCCKSVKVSRVFFIEHGSVNMHLLTLRLRLKEQRLSRVMSEVLSGFNGKVSEFRCLLHLKELRLSEPGRGV